MYIWSMKEKKDNYNWCSCANDKGKGYRICVETGRTELKVNDKWVLAPFNSPDTFATNIDIFSGKRYFPHE